MRSPVDAANRYPAAAFVVLALALSWATWIPLLSTIDGPVARLALIPGAFGPMAAAAVVTRLRGESVSEWLAATLEWRRSPRWYVAAVGVPLTVTVVLGVVVILSAGGLATDRLPGVLALFAVNTVFTTLLGGGQEEFGWRGFALPHLQTRYSALSASVVLGLVWALWHAPLFVFDIYALSAPLYAGSLVAIAVVFTWLYNGSRGCVPAAVLMHGMVNAGVNLPVQMVGGRSVLPVPFTALLAAAFGAVALALLWRYGPESLAEGPVQTPDWSTNRTVETTVAARRSTEEV